MPIRPPARRLIFELAIAVAIYIGALGASLLVALFISSILVALIPSKGEGALFQQPAILNCVLLVINPALFASVAANHCRRAPAYFIPLAPALGLSQTVLLWRRNSLSAEQTMAAVFRL